MGTWNPRVFVELGPIPVFPEEHREGLEASQRCWPGQHMGWRRRVCQRRSHSRARIHWPMVGEGLVLWGRYCLCDPSCVTEGYTTIKHGR